jgi:hypothetical protein
MTHSNDASQNTPAAKRKTPVGQKGYTGNPGGRPKALKDIERMLNDRHRAVENMRGVFDQLLALATRGSKGDAAYMKLYLERVLGPVKDLDDLDELLKDAPPEAIEFLRGLVH